MQDETPREVLLVINIVENGSIGINREKHKETFPLR